MHAGVNCVCNVCGSAHSCGCVVNETVLLGQPIEYYYNSLHLSNERTIYDI